MKFFSFGSEPAPVQSDSKIFGLFPALFLLFGLVILFVVFTQSKRVEPIQIVEERPPLRRSQRLINQRAARQ